MPKADENGQYFLWGLAGYYIYESFFTNISSPVLLKRVDPPVQFINELAHRKQSSIIASRKKYFIIYRISVARDYIIDVKLQHVDTKFKRRIRVSSSIPMDIFHDKVLAPALGWVRNYHAYLFTDSRDGAQFGPTSSTAIDYMHLGLNGYVCLDDSQYYLNDFLTMPLDVLYYIYDLGDHFEYTITLVNIKSPTESLGSCEVLEGEMAPLPEDSCGFPGGFKGNTGYEMMLEKFSGSGKGKICKQVLEALNYRNVKKYDPFEFNLDYTNQCLKKAFDSPNSLTFGAKIICRPAGSFQIPTAIQTRRIGGRTKEVLTPFEDCYIKEICSYGDTKGHTLCAHCGNPNKVKNCGSCRSTWYCGNVRL